MGGGHQGAVADTLSINPQCWVWRCAKVLRQFCTRRAELGAAREHLVSKELLLGLQIIHEQPLLRRRQRYLFGRGIQL